MLRRLPGQPLADRLLRRHGACASHFPAHDECGDAEHPVFCALPGIGDVFHIHGEIQFGCSVDDGLAKPVAPGTAGPEDLCLEEPRSRVLFEGLAEALSEFPDKSISVGSLSPDGDVIFFRRRSRSIARTSSSVFPA